MSQSTIFLFLTVALLVIIFAKPIESPSRYDGNDETGSESQDSKQHEEHINIEKHRKAQRQNLADACPHLKLGSGLKYKLHFFPILGRKGRSCCGCPPGTYFAGLCMPGRNNQHTTVCKPCDIGTYIEDDIHIYTECFVETNESLTCPNDEDYIYIPSSITTAPRCYCNPKKPLYLASNGSCLPYSPCPPGQGVWTFGNSFNDTVCRQCPNGYESQSLSATERCYPKESVKLNFKNKRIFFDAANSMSKTTHYSYINTVPTTRYDEPLSCTISNDEKQKDCSSSDAATIGYFFLGIIVGAILLMFGIFLYYQFRCNKDDRNRSYESRPPDQQPLANDSGVDLNNSVNQSLNGCNQCLQSSSSGINLESILIEFCIRTLEDMAERNEYELMLEDVVRFCHLSGIPEPTPSERSDYSAKQCMVRAVKLANDQGKTSFKEVVKYFLNRDPPLQTIVDKLLDVPRQSEENR